MSEILALEEIDPRLLLIAGILLMVLGRKLYWFCVGLVGFGVGLYLAQQALGSPSGAASWLLALLMAALAALAAVIFQKIAIGVAGFVVGGVLAFSLAEPYLSGLALGLTALAAGILCALLAKAVFEMALVVLSAIVGAGLVARVQDWVDVPTGLLWVGLAISSIIFQLAMSRKRDAKSSG